MTPADNYTRRCTIIQVVDGDTLHLSVDLGYDFRDLRMTVRLNGIDCPEKNTPAGQAAKAATTRWLTQAGNAQLHVESVRDKREKYGRYLATIWRANDPLPLNQWLINTGHAVPYTGGKR